MLRNPLSHLGHGFTLSLMPNQDGGTQNAYLGLYDENGRHYGTIDGKDLAAFAKALQPYQDAQLEPELQAERDAAKR